MHACLVVLMLVAAASARVTVYPPGVSPAACPNWPICPAGVDPATGHRYADIPKVKVYPAGVPAAACPNFPYCNETPSTRFVRTGIVQVPAGVPAAACVNYPYC